MKTTQWPTQREDFDTSEHHSISTFLSSDVECHLLVNVVTRHHVRFDIGQGEKFFKVLSDMVLL